MTTIESNPREEAAVQIRWRGAALGAVLIAAGCGESQTPPAIHPVSGKVLAGGKPAAGVEVRLFTLNRVHDSRAPRPTGTTDRDGRYTLRTNDVDGAPNGEYLAALAWPTARQGADRLEGALSDPQGSGLTAVITADTRELPPFEIPTPKRPR